MAEYKVDVRSEDARLTNRTVTEDPAVALVAFRRLLATPDFWGKPLAVRLVVGGRSLYYSKCDKPLGAGRIHPAAPISLTASREEADAVQFWKPTGETVLVPSDLDPALVVAMIEALAEPI